MLWSKWEEGSVQHYSVLANLGLFGTGMCYKLQVSVALSCLFQWVQALWKTVWLFWRLWCLLFIWLANKAHHSCFENCICLASFLTQKYSLHCWTEGMDHHFSPRLSAGHLLERQLEHGEPFPILWVQQWEDQEDAACVPTWCRWAATPTGRRELSGTVMRDVPGEQGGWVWFLCAALHAVFKSTSAFSDGCLSVFSLVTPAWARHCWHPPESDRPQYIGLFSEDLRTNHWEKVAIEHTPFLLALTKCCLLYEGFCTDQANKPGQPRLSAVNQTYSASQTAVIHSSDDVSALLVMLWQLWGGVLSLVGRVQGLHQTEVVGQMPDMRGCYTLVLGHVPAALVDMFLLLFCVLYISFLCFYSLKNKIWVNEFRWVTAFSLVCMCSVTLEHCIKQDRLTLLCS